MSQSHSRSGIYFFILHGKPNKMWPAFFTNVFTGKPAFHAGFVDLNKNELIDMYKNVRVASWPRYFGDKYDIRLYPADLIDRAGLDELIEKNKNEGYGYLDYLSFGIRWLANLVHVYPPDFRGTICSELVSEWANTFGYDFPVKPVLSPTGLERYIVEVLRLPRFM